MRATTCLSNTLKLAALTALAACAASNDGAPGGGGGSTVGGPMCAAGTTCAPTGPLATAGSGAGAAAAGTGGSISVGSAGTGSQPMPGATGVPCDIAPIISDNCTLCHGTQRFGGAPMSLMTLGDFHANAPTNAAMKVYEMIPARINAQQIGMRMPPASATALAAPQLATLNAWLSAGAQGGTCQITATPATGGAGDGTVIPMPGGSGGISPTPIEYNDPQMQCYEFLAHAPGNKMMPFSVPTTPDYYVNFDFMAPWDGMAYSRSYETVIDNADVLHHWLFYKNSGPKTDGGVAQSGGVHPDGQLQHGWAPGGDDMYFDPDVGAELAGGTSYTVEMHYNNTTGGPSPDQSGIRVCVTPAHPMFVAAISWLGTDNINGTMASGTCDPTSNERIHIIGATPHMHTKGNRMLVELTRAAGGHETIHDMPFDFNYQIGYIQDLWIEPGDTIKTTCFYNAPARFGEGTSDEMCYWFAMHYPSLALTNGNPISGVIHGPNNCLKLIAG